jgi:hypothetical protein
MLSCFWESGIPTDMKYHFKWLFIENLADFVRIFSLHCSELPGVTMIPGKENGNKIKKGEVLTLRLCHKPEHPANTNDRNACSIR